MTNSRQYIATQCPVIDDEEKSVTNVRAHCDAGPQFVAEKNLISFGNL